MLAVGAFPVAWFVALAVAIESMAATVWNVVMVSLRQQIIPPPLFGRVNSVYRWFGWGTLPIGSVPADSVAIGSVPAGSVAIGSLVGGSVVATATCAEAMTKTDPASATVSLPRRELRSPEYVVMRAP